MNKLFNADNPLNRFLAKVFDCGVLSVLWFVCSLPLFTVGASTIAMYYVALRMVKNEEGGIAKSFFRAFRENFRQSLFVTLFGLAGYTFLMSLSGVLSGGEAAGGILVPAIWAAFLLFTAVYVYVCPLLAMFDNTVAGTLNNAWRLAILHPLETGMFVILTVGPYVYFFMHPEHFIVIFPLWFLLGPGGLAYIMSIYFRKIFDPLIPDDTRNEEE